MEQSNHPDAEFLLFIFISIIHSFFDSLVKYKFYCQNWEMVS